jgi:hypothetical protein
MKKEWIAYYLLILGLLIWAADRAWIPVILLLGVIGFLIYRLFKGRDIERVTSIVFTLLCILVLLGVHGNFLTGLFVFTVLIELIF